MTYILIVVLIGALVVLLVGGAWVAAKNFGTFGDL